jgi:ABC-type multidrug transport system ATPase subunit
LEALQFSARMRQDADIPLTEKYEYVNKIIDLIEMKHLADALIGSLEEGIGISVEERKRLTIGLELVAKPHILFLDGMYLFFLIFTFL